MSVDRISVYITVIGFPIAIGAILLAWRQLVYARRSASAQMYIALNESFRQAWVMVAKQEIIDHAMNDIYNLLELSCLILNKEAFDKKIGPMLTDFVCQQIVICERNHNAAKIFQESIQTPTTFIEIINFMKKNRKLIDELRHKWPSAAT